MSVVGVRLRVFTISARNCFLDIVVFSGPGLSTGSLMLKERKKENKNRAAAAAAVAAAAAAGPGVAYEVCSDGSDSLPDVTTHWLRGPNWTRKIRCVEIPRRQ